MATTVLGTLQAAPNRTALRAVRAWRVPQGLLGVSKRQDTSAGAPGAGCGCVRGWGGGVHVGRGAVEVCKEEAHIYKKKHPHLDRGLARANVSGWPTDALALDHVLAL